MNAAPITRRKNSNIPTPIPMIIAFYLPQFHPIPENDLAWGPGFTEWHNVSLARPRFREHYQPHLPGELGFYDLRLDETRAAQAQLAREHGIDGFCYYSYWLDGKVILGEPLERTLKTGIPDIPFCLCWANENWTRAWDGRESQIILEQRYDAESLARYCNYLCGAFASKRYIRHEGRPLFIVYSPDEIPSTIDFAGMIRHASVQAALGDPFLIAVRHGRAVSSVQELLARGYDGTLAFQPNQNYFPTPRSPGALLKRVLRRWMPDFLYRLLSRRVESFYAVDYAAYVDGIRKLEQHPSEIACVFPSWDNTARRKIPTVIQNTDPERYSRWLEEELRPIGPNTTAPPFVFINAWNEWAEGCHLEPDQSLGRQFLVATRRATTAARQA